MTNPNPYYGAPPPPRKSRKGLVIVLVTLAVGLLLCGCAGIIAGATKGHDGARAIATTTEPTFAPPASAAPVAKSTPSPTPAPPTDLTPKTLALSVKITSKQCFGSAGCLVEWQVRGAVRAGVHIDGSCDVTYDVHGLTETQTHSMTVKDDGTYEQDAYQSGQTSRSSAKLSAKVTEVECS